MKDNPLRKLNDLGQSPWLDFLSRSLIAEAQRFRKRLDRPNIMVKVPGTTAGLQAIRELTSGGLNVNVTLLFSLERY